MTTTSFVKNAGFHKFKDVISYNSIQSAMHATMLLLMEFEAKSARIKKYRIIRVFMVVVCCKICSKVHASPCH